MVVSFCQDIQKEYERCLALAEKHAGFTDDGMILNTLGGRIVSERGPQITASHLNEQESGRRRTASRLGIHMHDHKLGHAATRQKNSPAERLENRMWQSQLECQAMSKKRFRDGSNRNKEIEIPERSRPSRTGRHVPEVLRRGVDDDLWGHKWLMVGQPRLTTDGYPQSFSAAPGRLRLFRAGGPKDAEFMQ